MLSDDAVPWLSEEGFHSPPLLHMCQGQVTIHDFLLPVQEELAASLGVLNFNFFGGNLTGRERYCVEYLFSAYDFR